MRIARHIFTLAALLQLACHSPTSPADVLPGPYGRLAGLVKIGPNCPVETATQPCPTPPSAYASRKILVFDEQRTKLLFTVDVDSQGLYFIDLMPGRYLVDLKSVGIDRSSDVPAVIDIHASDVTTLNISIDTGLR
jgi:hypothetical protein